MKSYNIVKKLQKEGYKITYKKWGYWDGVPHVQLDGFEFAIAEYTYQNGWMGCNLDFIFNEVLHAISIAEDVNPILDKKINQNKINNYWYNRYKILSMEDYYLYRREIYPYNESWEVLQKLNREFK